MKRIICYISVAALIIINPHSIFSQSAPNLKRAASYVLFNTTGEFTCNSANAIIVGNVGNQTGAINAFPPGFLFGDKHFGDDTASLIASDISDAYTALQNAPGCIAHAVAFGNDEILGPGVHCSGAASTFTGNLNLDAGNDPNAIFIIKIDGAFASVEGAQVILMNGASSCNVFWQIAGQVDLVNTVFKGTMLVNGDVNLSDGTLLEGRVFVKAGSLIFGSALVSICDITILPLQLLNFDVAKTADNNSRITWIAASEVNVARYELESSINGVAFHNSGTVSAKGNSFPTSYNFQDVEPNKTGVRFYRLKMIDFDGTFTYSTIKSLKFSDLKLGLVNIFPNPAGNTINITVNAETGESIALNIVNMHGQKVLQNTRQVNKGLNNITEDIHTLSKGTYIVNIKNIKTGIETRQNFQKL